MSPCVIVPAAIFGQVFLFAFFCLISREILVDKVCQVLYVSRRD